MMPDKPKIRPRRRHAAAIALIQKWLLEPDDYDERARPRIKAAIERDRLACTTLGAIVSRETARDG